MVTVRIVPRTQTSDQRQLQYQSARTRCVPPEDGSSSETLSVHWDEVFIFEVEPQVSAPISVTIGIVWLGMNLNCSGFFLSSTALYGPFLKL